MRKNFFNNLFMGATALIGVALLSSCEPGVTESNQTIPYAAMNVVYPTESGEPATTWQSYTVKFDYKDLTETVVGNFVYNNINYNFSTSPAKYKNVASDGVYGVYAGGFSGSFNQSMLLSDCAFFITNMILPEGISYRPGESWIPTFKDDKGNETYHPGAIYTPRQNVVPVYFIGKYKAGSQYSVMTFSSDLSFFGTTTTSYPATENYPAGSFNNSQMIYRVFLDTEKKQADVVIYNAKFAENAPSLDVIYLPSLSLKFEDEGYVIEGTSIVPKTPEGEGKDQTLVDNPRYTFNTFKMTSKPGTVLTGADITYQVGEAFSGSFTGKYVDIPSEMKGR